MSNGCPQLLKTFWMGHRTVPSSPSPICKLVLPFFQASPATGRTPLARPARGLKRPYKDAVQAPKQSKGPYLFMALCHTKVFVCTTSEGMRAQIYPRSAQETVTRNVLIETSLVWNAHTETDLLELKLFMPMHENFYMSKACKTTFFNACCSTSWFPRCSTPLLRNPGSDGGTLGLKWKQPRQPGAHSACSVG